MGSPHKGPVMREAFHENTVVRLPQTSYLHNGNSYADDIVQLNQAFDPCDFDINLTRWPLEDVTVIIKV